MMENWELLLMPLVGGIIGWITNMIAIKMLFWPKQQIPFLSWEFAGLPKHLELARSIGEIIERDLLPLDDLLVYFQKWFQDHGWIVLLIMWTSEFRRSCRALFPLALKN